MIDSSEGTSQTVFGINTDEESPGQRTLASRLDFLSNRVASMDKQLACTNAENKRMEKMMEEQQTLFVTMMKSLIEKQVSME